MNLGTDLDAIIQMAPGSVTVVVGATTGSGVEDVSRYDLLGSGGEAVERVRELLLSSNTFALAALTRGTAITVNAASYTIRDAIAEDDGRLIRVLFV